MKTIFLDANVIAAIIALIGSCITVSITYYKTQKLKLFDTYFAAKSKSYELFWKSASNYFETQSAENKSALRSSLYCIGLYSSKTVFDQICNLTNSLFSNSMDIGSYAEKAMGIMNDDLAQCKDTIRF